MTPPATTVAGPTASADLASAEALRGEVQKLQHIIRHALPALRAVHDDPCKPAQRVLLGEVIDDLTEGLVSDDSEIIPPSCLKRGTTGDGGPTVHPWTLDDIVAAMNGDYR